MYGRGSNIPFQECSEAATTDPDYARLKDADIEFIDESGDELDDELGRLQGDEDVTVESSAGSSLIHMSGEWGRMLEFGADLTSPHFSCRVWTWSPEIVCCRDRTRRHDTCAKQGQRAK